MNNAIKPGDVVRLKSDRQDDPTLMTVSHMNPGRGCPVASVCWFVDSEIRWTEFNICVLDKIEVPK
jgi:hypothetical protein